MPKLYVTAAIPGSLYVNGTPAANMSSRDDQAPVNVPVEGAYVAFMPYVDGYLPFARFIPGAKTPDPLELQGMNAVLWPGGTVEITIRPTLVVRPPKIAAADFAGGSAALYAAGQVMLELPGGYMLDVGEGDAGGLYSLPGGLLAAFASGKSGEALRVLLPDSAGGANTALHVRGKQVLLSAEGDRVRVTEHGGDEATREYRYLADRGAFVLEKNASVPSNVPQFLPRAFADAMMAGKTDAALALLSSSLRMVVDAQKLTSFIGRFDGYVDARHAPTIEGVHTLAFLQPIGEEHIARVFAFEVVEGDGAYAIDNIRAWEGSD